MEARDGAGYGPMFVMSLVMSWTLTTGAIGMLAWSDDRSPERLATWISLWVFTVAVPTIQAIRIHRVLSEITRGAGHSSPRSRRALEHARVLILICGTMTVLLVFGLVVKR